MRFFYLLCFCLAFLTTPSIAQRNQEVADAHRELAAVDALALKISDDKAKTTQGLADYINTHFKTEEDKVRAIFVWVATNIDYDLANMYKPDYYTSREEVVIRTLATRKGICQGYAEIFQEVCQKTGLRAYVVEGYTKQNGSLDYIPHAWTAARIDGAWFLFDPTWGSGYETNGKYIRKVNNAFYKVQPKALVSSHLPFDPLWQFLPYPVTHQEFVEGKTTMNPSKPRFHFQDSLAVYDSQDELARLAATARRVEANGGAKNPLVADRLQYYKGEIDVILKNESVDRFNAASSAFNQGVKMFNQFIAFRNKQFLPQKSDAELHGMLSAVAGKINESQKLLGTITYADKNQKATITAMGKNLQEMRAQVKEQQVFLDKYLATAAPNRRTLFYK